MAVACLTFTLWVQVGQAAPLVVNGDFESEVDQFVARPGYVSQ
jgi:hypothetical protein